MPSADDVLALLAKARASERREVCPVSREFDLAYYEGIATVRYAQSPIFLEIPKGLRVEEDVEEYRPQTQTWERKAPSSRISVYDEDSRNPFHGTGDSKIRIFCRVQDGEGNWWLAKKNSSNGGFTYFLADDMKPVSKRQK